MYWLKMSIQSVPRMHEAGLLASVCAQLSLQTNSQSDGIGHALNQGNTISTILLQGQTNPPHLRGTASEIPPRLALSYCM
jgi:hypothetical protein